MVEFARLRLGFLPDLRQEALLLSGVSRGMVNCSRQWGKSTVAAVMAVHRAYFRGQEPGGGGVPYGEAERGAGLEGAGFMVSWGCGAAGWEQSDQLAVSEWVADCRVPGREALCAGFGGFSLMIDEASRVEDAVYKALRPMLAVGDGDLWLLSTPFGKRGFFYENWAGGSEDWKRMSVPATECSRITEEFLEEERQADGGFVVPAGVYVRVHGERAADVRAGIGDGGVG